jgi:hypothetical protein
MKDKIIIELKALGMALLPVALGMLVFLLLHHCR